MEVTFILNNFFTAQMVIFFTDSFCKNSKHQNNVINKVRFVMEITFSCVFKELYLLC